MRKFILVLIILFSIQLLVVLGLFIFDETTPTNLIFSGIGTCVGLGMGITAWRRYA